MDRLYRKIGTSFVYTGVQLDNSVVISQEEFDEVTLENIKIRIREVRDQKIRDIEWRFRRYEDETILDLPHNDDIARLAAYVQALRDVPQQEGFPEDIVWPTLGGGDE
ncbi:MAG: phage tail assembly chaperone [Sphaerochaeta sp.]|nr:phage tail assembly chaperone [Sphaerochaeta sp.]